MIVQIAFIHSCIHASTHRYFREFTHSCVHNAHAYTTSSHTVASIAHSRLRRTNSLNPFKSVIPVSLVHRCHQSNVKLPVPTNEQFVFTVYQMTSSNKWTPQITSSNRWTPETTSSNKWTPQTTSSNKWTSQATSSNKWTPQTTSSNKWTPQTTSSNKWTSQATSSNQWVPQATSSNKWTSQTASSRMLPSSDKRTSSQLAGPNQQSSCIFHYQISNDNQHVLTNEHFALTITMLSINKFQQTNILHLPFYYYHVSSDKF